MSFIVAVRSQTWSSGKALLVIDWSLVQAFSQHARDTELHPTTASESLGRLPGTVDAVTPTTPPQPIYTVNKGELPSQRHLSVTCAFLNSEMPIIQLETLIDSPIERCFDLSRDIELHMRSTLQTGEIAIAGVTKGLINMGEQVNWEAKHFGVRANG